MKTNPISHDLVKTASVMAKDMKDWQRDESELELACGRVSNYANALLLFIKYSILKGGQKNNSLNILPV